MIKKNVGFSIYNSNKFLRRLAGCFRNHKKRKTKKRSVLTPGSNLYFRQEKSCKNFTSTVRDNNKQFRKCESQYPHVARQHNIVFTLIYNF